MTSVSISFIPSYYRNTEIAAESVGKSFSLFFFFFFFLVDVDCSLVRIVRLRQRHRKIQNKMHKSTNFEAE